MFSLLKKIAFFSLVLLMLATFLYPVNQVVRAGTPDDSYTVDRYYVETNHEGTPQTTTNTSGSPVTAATLTFTPKATKNYLIIASALATSDSTTEGAWVYLDVDSTTTSDLATFIPLSLSPLGWRSWGIHKVVSLDAQEHDIYIKFYAGPNTTTAKVLWTTITAIEVTNYVTAAAEAPANITNTTFDVDNQLETASISAGTYLILATANTRNKKDVPPKDTDFQLTINGTPHGLGTTSYKEDSASSGVSAYSSYQQVEVVTVRSSFTARLDFLAKNPNDGNAKDYRVTAVKLSDLGTYEWGEETGPITDTTGSYVAVDSSPLTFDPNVEANWLVLASGLGNQATTSNEYYAKLVLDNTNLGEYIFTASDKTLYRSYFMLRRLTLTDDSHTIQFYHHTTTPAAGTAGTIEANVVAIKLATMESHSDSGFVTVWGNVDTEFDTYGNLVYLRGMGFTPGTNYRIAYYDNGASGGQFLKNTDTSSDTKGELTDNTFYPSNWGSATAGNWKAVVSSQSHTPETNYSDYSTAQKIAADTSRYKPPQYPNSPRRWPVSQLS